MVFSSDHGLNSCLDKMPTFAVGAAAEHANTDEGWGLPLYKTFAGHPALSWHVIEQPVYHAISIPLELACFDAEKWPVKLVPIGINTVQPPLPSAKRCLWIAARGALRPSAQEIHRSYHIPISNTAAATVLMEPRLRRRRRDRQGTRPEPL